MTNYPPGVSGNEYEIAGPDYEKDISGVCPKCSQSDVLAELGYRGERWIVCAHCDYEEVKP